MTVTALRAAPLDPSLLAERTNAAAAIARQAADVAKVIIRSLDTPEECGRASDILGMVWQMAPGKSPMEPNLLRALEHSGSYVVGAYSDTGELLGVTVAFLSEGRPLEIHSHVTGIVPAAQGRGLGAALKLDQCAWALARGIETITWTYDPLVRRNASFNLHRLKAGVGEYLTNFYGEMNDGINAGAESDRLMIRWDLVSDGAPKPLPEGPQVLSVGAGGHPLSAGARNADVVLVDVPTDIERMRRTDPATASAWRLALRGALEPRLAAGWTISGFNPTKGYVLCR